MGIKFKISEERWHGCRYYLVVPKWSSDHTQLLNWCTEHFGPRGNPFNGELEQWYANSTGFFFRGESDLTMFILRWE